MDKYVSAKELKETLQYTNQNEFLVVLAAAEKIKKGIYITIEGDPLQEAESVIELFSDF